MKKALIVTHVSGFVPQFEMNNVRILQDMGYEVHYASNFNNVSYGEDNHRLDGTGIVCHQVDFARSPFEVHSLIKAYGQLKELLCEEKFDLLHCHTPVAGVLSRFAAIPYRKRGLKVIYTAHGFHFYKGAPFKFWMVSYPVEWWLAHYTDALITINEEDFKNASKFRLAKRNRKPGSAYKINSVGIDVKKYQPQGIAYMKKREELGIPENAFVFISVGELNWNKNHTVAVNALGKIYKQNPDSNIFYIICGEGIEKIALQEQADAMGISDKVILTGFREDIPEMLQYADGMIFPSRREGLGLVAIEAMAAGVPVIASDNRGTREYMKNEKNGYVVPWDDVDMMAEQMLRLSMLDSIKIDQMKKECLCTAERFSSDCVNEQMKKIYKTME